MPVASLTDAQISELIACEKQVDAVHPKERREGKHLRRDFSAISSAGGHGFVIFTRQSTMIAASFSAGIRWKSKTGEEVILLRCNGSDHAHRNFIEGESFSGSCHVHRATERYALRGRKIESFALVEASYSTLDGALRHLAQLANISGLEDFPETPDLFDSP